jgi:hypothetical protein
MVCEPTGRELVVKLADPEARVAVPSDVLPSEKVIVPEGEPDPEPGATFAVNTAGVPKAGVVGVTARVVVVAIRAGGGGVFCPLPAAPLPPLQPTVIRSALNRIIESERRGKRRRLGNSSSSSPAMPPVNPAPIQPRCKLRTSATEIGFAESGAASCRVSVDVTAPVLPTTAGLKEHAIPAGIVAGQAKVNEFCASTVLLGVTVTTTLPVPLGDKVNDAGLIVVTKDPVRSIVNEGIVEGL